MESLVFFTASFLYLFLIGLQQKVVQANQWQVAAFVSMAISTANFYVVTNAASNDYLYFMLTAGLGSALGITCSIFAHDRLLRLYKGVLKWERSS